MLKTGLHSAQVVKSMHSIRARSKLARRLRPSQQQEAKDGSLVAVEIKGFLQAVLVLRHSAVRRADGSDERLHLQRMQRLAHSGLIEIHNWLAIRLLIAGVDQRVQRKRIVLRRGHFLLDERA